MVLNNDMDMSILTESVGVAVVPIVLVILVVAYDRTKGRDISPFLEQDFLKAPDKLYKWGSQQRACSS
jgi:hypothetical protein